MVIRAKGLLALPVMAIVLLSVAANDSCGADADADPTPVRTWAITPAEPGFRASPTPRPETATPPGVQPKSAAAPTLTIAGVNSTFDKDTLMAAAGAIEIRFDNRDGRVIHNIHFFRGSTARVDDAGETDLEPGPIEQTLTLRLEPGEYFYQCDAHRTTMKGTLTVR